MLFINQALTQYSCNSNLMKEQFVNEYMMIMIKFHILISIQCTKPIRHEVYILSYKYLHIKRIFIILHYHSSFLYCALCCIVNSRLKFIFSSYFIYFTYIYIFFISHLQGMITSFSIRC